MGFESFPYFPDGWTTNDLIYKWKEQNPVQLTKNLSLPGGFKLANYSNHNCDVVTATGGFGQSQPVRGAEREGRTDCRKSTPPLAVLAVVKEWPQPNWSLKLRCRSFAA